MASSSSEPGAAAGPVLPKTGYSRPFWAEEPALSEQFARPMAVEQAAMEILPSIH